jgi:hypothetical protein
MGTPRQQSEFDPPNMVRGEQVPVSRSQPSSANSELFHFTQCVRLTAIAPDYCSNTEGYEIR